MLDFCNNFILKLTKFGTIFFSLCNNGIILHDIFLIPYPILLSSLIIRHDAVFVLYLYIVLCGLKLDFVSSKCIFLYLSNF